MKIRMLDEFEFFICHASSNILYLTKKIIHSKMEDLASVIILSELVDSDDEKPTRGKTRQWIRRRKERGHFTNIIQELIIEDRHGFREMFRMDVRDFEFVLNKIADLITPRERLGGTRPIDSDERLALTLTCFLNVSPGL